MTTENQVVKYVQSNARYYSHGYRFPDGSLGGCYAVVFESKVYTGESPRDLVEDMCEDLEIDFK